MIKLIIDMEPSTKELWKAYAARRNRPVGMAFMMFIRKFAEEIITKHSKRPFKKRVSIRRRLKKKERKTRFVMVSSDGKSRYEW